MNVFHKNYNELISIDNIFSAWKEFKRGKAKKKEVLEFERCLEDNLFALHEELSARTYKHGQYTKFKIWDPKYRIISKTTIKDRIVHHLVFAELYKIFDKSFIFHSYSSRNSKGTHLAVKNLAGALRAESRNYSRAVFALKCDIKKFFDNINHGILLKLINRRIKDKYFMELIKEIIASFNGETGVGLPIGNITSQVFANIYLNELDQFAKRTLKIKYYFRYADDFVAISRFPKDLREQQLVVNSFLNKDLFLMLHPAKVKICKLKQGIDFLGYVILPGHIVLRTKTKKRMFRKMQKRQELLVGGELDYFNFEQSRQSYCGMLQHCSGHKLTQRLFRE